MDPLTSDGLNVREVAPDDPALQPLILSHLRYSQDASPATSNHTMDAQTLASEPGLRMWLAERAGAAVGCGALKPLGDGSAEVKSVHVASNLRGGGVGRAVMESIIAQARAAGFHALFLETGPAALPGYDAARGLYERLGFSYCGPFVGYEPDPFSAFMRLELQSVAPT